MIFFITFTDMLYYCIQTCIMMCYCILQLWLSSQGHSLLFFFLLFRYCFIFLHLFSYCKVSSSEFLYCIAYAKVYVFIIYVLQVSWFCFWVLIFVFPVLIDFLFRFCFCVLSLRKKKRLKVR